MEPGRTIAVRDGAWLEIAVQVLARYPGAVDRRARLPGLAARGQPPTRRA